MKRIITCSDGTWNKPGVEDKGQPVRTNVQKMFEAISKYDTEKKLFQLKYYDEGVGAEGNWWTRVFNGATGKGIDENILNSYKFIMWNYEEGDELYLFGFSRGAYTARSLAGFIRNCGILKNNNLGLIKKAYAIYRDRTDATGPNSDYAKKFREDNCYDISCIKFIGVWDTVGSLGIPINSLQFINKKKYAFHDTTLSSIVDYAYHALSIDEKRGNFKPTLWNISTGVIKRNTPQILEQKWFAGVHSNVGGGYPDEGLSDIALRWMVNKAKNSGLVFEEDYLNKQVKPSINGKLYNSLVFPYTLGPRYVRPLGKGLNANETVDETAIQRFNEIPDYKSPNLEMYINSQKEI